ncbi:hypothetical protein FA95DRAFT_1564985 [Auriscalpium vulgare]|uniref:Uncharacterized protein n=1 Tax=Auriscalpium vulgare TaxID=40419 RepID=A0ACB8RCM9_9AGAM|nr:hypothetical protein FA95DRAFT_1564985 [Auriscalpium vulgare]
MSANVPGCAANEPQSPSPKDATASIPNEVLSNIFSFIPDDRPYFPVYTRIVQVSRRWRAVALACPQLWTHLNFRHRGLSWRASANTVKDLLALSKSAPLVILYDNKMYYDE